MADDILSQSEIDALLSALSSGEMDATELKSEEGKKKIKDYDFKRALRFSKDQVRGLTRIHENFARLLTSFYSGQLRTFVSIQVASVDQIPYEEFIRSIPNRTILNVFSVSPLEGRLLFEISPNIAYAILDRLLGGRGTGVNKIENLTEIETTIMSRIFERSMEALEESWSSMIEIKTVLEEFEVNPQFIRMVSPNETVIVITLNVQMGETSGMMNICIPHIVLEPIVSKLSVHYWMENQTSKVQPENYEKMSKSLKNVPVEAKVILGDSTISIQEFLNLQVDDCIVLNQKIDEPLIMYTNEQPKFYVQPGKRKSNIAVQIIDEIRGESDE